MKPTRFLWPALYMFCCAVSVFSAKEEMQRRSLELEILKHVVNFLRMRLVHCLEKVPASSRQKRKAVGKAVAYEVDMAIMSNTKDYLMGRLLQCRELRKSHKQKQAGATQRPVTSMEIIQPETDFPVKPARPTKASKFISTPDNLLPVFIKPTRIIKPANTVVKQTHQIPPESFLIDGRKVSCSPPGVTLGQPLVTFTCHDLRIDGAYRLPNYDICMEYSPNNWKPIHLVRNEAFGVLDLKGFCVALTTAYGLHGAVQNVEVVWGCDGRIHSPRPKWLNGGWRGTVDDNAYLHDIRCYLQQQPQVRPHVT